jgi:ketosteroid isomerase-like protein
VARGFEALSRGVEEALPLIDPEFEMETVAPYAAEPGTYRGWDGVRRWFAGFEGAMEQVRVEPRTLEDAGEGKVVVEFVLSARGVVTGLEVSQEAVALITLNGEKLRAMEFHPSVEAARAAAAS